MRGLIPKFVVVLFLAVGCVTRGLPLPPPSAVVQSVVQCPVTDCPMGGVIVTLGGSDAQARAIITAIDDERSPEGMSVVGGSARATAAGVWSIVIAPPPGVMGGLRAVQRGDTIRVFQVNEMGEASNSTYVRIPTM